MTLIFWIMLVSLVIGGFWRKMNAVSWMLLLTVIVVCIGKYAYQH